jgi:hypothetical protein
MRKAHLVPLIVLALLTVGAVSARADVPTNECNGIQQCARARGPWVVVPAHGWAQYLLNCPGRRGIAAGVEAIASSTAVHVSWDAKLGSPASPGRSTQQYVFFRAVSSNGRVGFFQPRIGCIPTSPTRSTYMVKATVPGAPLNIAATNVRLKAGTIGKTTIGCIPTQTLVDSWTAVAFRTEKQTRPELAQAIQVQKTVEGKGKKVAVRIAVSEALPPGSGAEVQLGVMCAQS